MHHDLRRLSEPETLFSGSVLLARVEAAEGHGRGAVEQLGATMLARTTDDEQRAELYYWLWKLAESERGGSPRSTAPYTTDLYATLRSTSTTTYRRTERSWRSTHECIQSNELRVFISSTFRDLQEEREHLIKKIFPEIRSLCRERGITFTEVDLRWGLTEEERARAGDPHLSGGDRSLPPILHRHHRRTLRLCPGAASSIHKDPELLAHIHGWRMRRWRRHRSSTWSSAMACSMSERGGRQRRAKDAERTGAVLFRQPASDVSMQESGDEEWNGRGWRNLKQRVRRAGLPVEEFRDPASLGEMIFDELVRIIDGLRRRQAPDAARARSASATSRSPQPPPGLHPECEVPEATERVRRGQSAEGSESEGKGVRFGSLPDVIRFPDASTPNPARANQR